ncbi:protein PAT1 homolog 1 isoform X2 [Myxocyprinus asiaticus]|uniref:protein PAT1 homolog 1 isoform X2 n=1 Tax=Myxocyprinus asiaticus TaxID=70543 RepID=UPI002221671E|nr:protein PAT1 homolog 1 isoform X2 [Myxocyprinus asiaticus]
MNEINQSLNEDCTLEEEGLVEEEDEIDQFNDDTFGAGAIDDDWQEEHARLAELDELVRDGPAEAGDTTSTSADSTAHTSALLPPASSSRLHSDIDEQAGGDLAESLTRLILGSDPAIAVVGTASSDRSHLPLMLSSQTHPSALAGQSSLLLSYQRQQKLLHRGSASLSQINSHSIWENNMGFSPVSVNSGLVNQTEDSPLLSIIKEVGLPKRPPALGREEGQDFSERVPPPRSSSPVIGSPPVRAVPIGTPPKQPMSQVFNHQNNHPSAVHVRASVPLRYPPPFPERLSPNNLLSIANSQLSHSPFPAGVGPVLSQIQRAQLLNSQFQRGPGPLLQGGVGGFRPFFGQSGPRVSLHGPLLSHAPIRHNTTHLHPQHRRMLNQRMQSRGSGDHVGGRGVGERKNRDPYSNLMTQREKEWVARIQMMQLQSTDPYLDDYYYQNYYEKMEKRQERDRDNRKEHTTKLITPQVAKLEHTYRPVQFAGSLGKLTVSSVNNPRKMIDAVVTTRSDDEEKREKQVWNKRRQILYTVEKMYSLLLEVQDFEKKFLQTPEHQRDALLEQHKTHTLQLYNSLREKEWDDRVSDEHCLMIMSVRKGKRLISRLLPLLSHPQAAAVVMAIARKLPALVKKDKQDQVLCWLVEPVMMVIQSMSSTSLTDLLQELQGSEGQLTLVLQNKFGVTLLYLILSEGERMQSSDPNCQLMDDNRWTELVFSVTRELLKVPSSVLSSPMFTPPNLVSLFSRYVDRQRLELLQEKLQITDLSR